MGRGSRPEDITRGASNTIAVLGVTERCGAWAAGGDGSVRALTQRPYVNGPDGFGSGQPDGMLAGMADGAVRFISKDVDPRVLEQLATIHGSNEVTAAALERKPAAAKAAGQGPAVGPATARRNADASAQENTAGPQDGQDEPAAPEDPRTAAPAINVEARLADKIPEIDLPDVPLGDASTCCRR